jgi:hypothetical protein
MSIRKSILLLLIPVLCHINLNAQNNIAKRIIFIGDAGEINLIQKNIIQKAIHELIAGKTQVVYLGDNIYSDGMKLPGDPQETHTQNILTAQFKPFRERQVPVYFVPGNHDWDRSGKNGLEKIQAQSAFLESQNDSLLALVPANGCPDPVVQKIAPGVTMIYLDTEWWLFPYSKANENNDCDCTTPEEVSLRLKDLVYQHKNDKIILAGHHPFVSYGNHGGHFYWMDHLFPLRAANKKMYIPLPVAGSLYPLLRKTISHPEDIAHPRYKNMIRQITTAFEGHNDWLYIAGHEHGLQYIQRGNLTQLVSGGGSRIDYVKKSKKAFYTSHHAGFVTIDLLTDGQAVYTFHSLENNTWKKTTFQQPAIAIKNSIADYQFNPVNSDSVQITLQPSYDEKSNFHRWLFGENFRKEYATPVHLPVFKISAINGGLTPTQRGGGMQSVSLRLVDKEGNEYALRSVLKRAETVLPEGLRNSFAKDWVDDAMSAQHPYSALIVPPLARAIGVPHANPVIGFVSADSTLHQYNYTFANTVALLEERNPLGKSDNTLKFLKNIQNDNDNRFDAITFFKSRILDVLIGDWDRHEDQWRWKNLSSKGEDKFYVDVPRDRDQVFHVTEGLFPNIMSRPYLLPTFQGWRSDIPSIRYSLFKSNFLNAHPASQMSWKQWEALVTETIHQLNDTVLNAAIYQLPAAIYNLRGADITKTLQNRRDALLPAFKEFYQFIHKKVDVRLSDKHEKVSITQNDNGDIHLLVQKINKNGKLTDTLLTHNYASAVTKELRIYLSKGDDSVWINTPDPGMKIRIIGDKGKNNIFVKDASKKIHYYGQPKHTNLEGSYQHISRHLRNNKSISLFEPVNLYNFWAPSFDIGLNVDDGLILGTGFTYTHKSGFRKLPFTYQQSLTLAHSFSTNAYRIKYRGEWTEILHKTNLVLQANIKAPNNTINFYGHGNETSFQKFEGHKRFYRARYSIYNIDALLKWNSGKDISFSAGPTAQFYHFKSNDTIGRFISHAPILTYDSSHITSDKAHTGLKVHFLINKKNRMREHSWGYVVDIHYQWLWGINKWSENYGLLEPSLMVYNRLDRRGNIRLYNRIGGTLTMGKNPFFQSAFLGGHGNLLGYRQYRFAGNHAIYHNIETHLKLAEITNYLLPGELGIIALHDIGRVWQKNEDSKKFHNSYGGGIYFSPGNIATVNFVMAGSKDGWYPYVKMGLRF